MTDSLWLYLALGIVGIFCMAIPVFWLMKKMRENSKKTFLKKVVDAVLLPINFGALFLENRKLHQLPFYYRWFLQFTRFTSRIHYFHFLPKAIIAIVSEGMISLVTGQDVLTALVFCWSVLFLIIITIVEGRSGEMDEGTVVFANKLFLYTVSMITLGCFIVYFFLWEGMLEPVFNTPFLQFMGHLAHEFNAYLILLITMFWDSPFLVKIATFAALALYVTASVYVSKKIHR